MPALINARSAHSSIAIDKHLYAIGGALSAPIEILDLVTKRDWSILLEHHFVNRKHAAVTCISSDKIVVFGTDSA